MAAKLIAFTLLLGVATAKEPCCKTCTLPLVKFFSTDSPHGFCGEACMDPKRFSTFHMFEKNLTLATTTNPCMEQWTPSNTKHYTDYFDTVTHGGLGVSVTLDLYAPTAMPDHSCCDTPLFSSLNCVGIPFKPTSLTIFGTGPYCCPKGATEEKPCTGNVVSAPVAAKDDCQTYRKIADGACGDVCLPSSVGMCPRGLLAKMGGLENGTCKDEGYTVDKGEMDQKAGPCGTLKIEKWAKASEPVAATDDCQTFMKVSGDSCGDVCLASTIGICPRAIVTKMGGLAEGKCKDKGYTVDKGEVDQKAGPCGTLKIEKWAKAEIFLV